MGHGGDKGRRAGDRPGGQPQRGEIHGVQRPDGPEAAHRELAGKDGIHRPGRIYISRQALYPGGPAGDLLPHPRQRRRGGHPRLPPLRPGGRDAGGGGRHLPGTEFGPGPPGAGDLLASGGVREPAGRGGQKAHPGGPDGPPGPAGLPGGGHLRPGRLWAGRTAGRSGGSGPPPPAPAPPPPRAWGRPRGGGRPGGGPFGAGPGPPPSSALAAPAAGRTAGQRPLWPGPLPSRRRP